MRGILLGFLGLILNVAFLAFMFFSDSSAVNSSGEIEPLTAETKTDSLNVPAGNYSEIYRPPVYIGIGPGGPPNHIIKLKTGTIKRVIPDSYQ